MESSWCVSIVERAIERYGVPEIFNTDQGSQFTSTLFTQNLLNHSIRISMDGYKRALDNIYIERFWRNLKQEKVYINVYETGTELYHSIAEYMDFYNHHRPHQGIENEYPMERYKKIA
jgi:putative transposase